MSKRKLPSRVKVPEAFDGPYTGLLIGTYGAYLPFAERQLFRHLPKSVVNRVILADRSQLTRHLEVVADLRKLNRTYVAAGVSSPRAHHPKYIVLVGPEAGALLVGSGNLSVSGYTGAGECFTTYRWSTSDGQHADAFATIRLLVDGLRARGWIDAVVSSRLADLFDSAPWIPRTEAPTGPVRHNLDRSFLDQLAEVVGDRTTSELVAAAPFHDQGARALRALIERFSPDRVVLLVQEHETRLDVVAMSRLFKTRDVGLDLVEIAAPKPYPPTYLHAKFLLIRTSNGDVLLQGSPNLSAVALVNQGETANVEVANLLDGLPGAFDSILAGVTQTAIADGLAGFEPSAWDEAADEEMPLDHLIDTLTWIPPNLEGRLDARVPKVELLRVVIGGRTLTPVSGSVEVAEDGRTTFALEFNDEDAARIDAAGAGVRIQIGDESTSEVVYPYHLHSLVRFSTSGHRVDLLQEAGALDLNDRELEDLLAELDRVLIVDGRSLWRLAHPHADIDTTEDELGPHVSYEDLDWNRIGEQPSFAQYRNASQRMLLAPTELGIVLHALTDRFHAEIRLADGVDDETALVADDDDLGLEPEVEDEEALDEEDDAGPRRQAATTRVRRLWRGFVRRFVRGLGDADFVRSVGSSVIIPGYIVFNHLCRRLRVVGLIDADYLTEAQIQLWTFMWGDETDRGYLHGLSQDERTAALQILRDHEDLPAMLAAIDDAWWYVWESGADYQPLRDALRAFLDNEYWNPTPETLARAAAVAAGAESDPATLLEDLAELAEANEWYERDAELAAGLGVQTEAIEETSAVVKRGGRSGTEKFLRVSVPTYDLTPASAADAIAIWAEYEPERTYFRLATRHRVAIVDLTVGTRTYYDLDDGTEQPLEIRPRQMPHWRRRLSELKAA